MIIKTDIQLEDFEAWSGGKDRLNVLKRSETAMNEVEAFIEEIFPDGLSDTDLNDILWFDDYVQEIVDKVESGDYSDAEDEEADWRDFGDEADTDGELI